MRDLFEKFFTNNYKGIRGGEEEEIARVEAWRIWNYTEEILKEELEKKQQKIDKLEKENQALKAKVEKLESKLIFSHSFILNVMDNWNYLRDVLSNVSTKKYDDGKIEWADCCDLEMVANDFYKAKRFSENFAMGNFKEWFHEIKVTYGHKSLDDHEDFKDQYWRRGLKEIKEGEG